MKRIIGTALACLTVAACGTPDQPPQAAAAATDCGTFTLQQGDTLPESAPRCLAEAMQAGQPAQLKVTRPTVEGDPIPVTYTAGADGRVEVVTDSRQDGFGAQEITRQTCTGPVALPKLDFDQCSEPTAIK